MSYSDLEVEAVRKEIEMKEAIEILRMEGWVAAADRLQVLLGLLPSV